MTRGIFISYRRSDSSGYAGRIFDRLAPSFSREHVFMDVDNIELGVDFVEVLSDRVASCDALLAIIGHDWLNSLDARGKRRLDDPHDFVRIEIEAALKRNTRVIPVLVEGATMPSSEELPEPLKGLARRQGVEISHNRFDSDADILIRALRRIIDAKDREREAAAAPAPELSPASSSPRQETEAPPPRLPDKAGDIRVASPILAPAGLIDPSGDDGGAMSRRPGARDAHPPHPSATTVLPGPATIDPSGDDGGAASRRPGARDAHPPHPSATTVLPGPATTRDEGRVPPPGIIDRSCGADRAMMEGRRPAALVRETRTLRLRLLAEAMKFGGVGLLLGLTFVLVRSMGVWPITRPIAVILPQDLVYPLAAALPWLRQTRRMSGEIWALAGSFYAIRLIANVIGYYGVTLGFVAASMIGPIQWSIAAIATGLYLLACAYLFDLRPAKWVYLLVIPLASANVAILAASVGGLSYYSFTPGLLGAFVAYYLAKPQLSGGAAPEHPARSNEPRPATIEAGQAKPFVYHRGMRIAGDIVMAIVVWIAALMVVGFGGLWLGIRASLAVTLAMTTILAGLGHMALRHLRVRPPGEPRA